jgi:hypothetical protein
MPVVWHVLSIPRADSPQPRKAPSSPQSIISVRAESRWRGAGLHGGRPMKRIVIWMLLAALGPGFATAAEPNLLPTIPQVPAPTLNSESRIIPAAGVSGRVLGNLRERIGLSMSANRVTESVEQVEAASVAPLPGCDHCVSAGSACGSSIIPGSPIKRWLCFRPTTGHELPWLRPNPYIGPITGQFRCSSARCAQCGGQAGCGADCAKGDGGQGRIGGLGRGGRGCANGTCIPPADEVFAGYKFATPERSMVVTTPTSTSYKPSISPTGLATSTAPRPPTMLESLKRAFRP